MFTAYLTLNLPNTQVVPYMELVARDYVVPTIKEEMHEVSWKFLKTRRRYVRKFQSSHALKSNMWKLKTLHVYTHLSKIHPIYSHIYSLRLHNNPKESRNTL